MQQISDMIQVLDGIFIGLLSIVSVIGVLGNLFAVYTVINGKLLKKRLWYYLLSLSCSDIFSFVVISPLTIAGFYDSQLLNRNILCNLQGSTMNFLMGWSLITIGFVNISKYRSVKAPVTNCTKDKRSLKIYALVTFPTSVFIAVAPIIGLSSYIHLPGRSWCEVRTSDSYQAVVYIMISAFFILSVIVVVSNVATARYVHKEIRNYTDKYEVNGAMAKTFTQRKSRVYHTSLVVTILFFVCWVPLFVLIVMQGFRLKIPLLFAKLSYFLAFVQGCLNPVIYFFRHGSFKNRLRKLLKKWKQKRTRADTHISIEINPNNAAT